MTDQEFQRWLRSSDARRCAIIELDSTPPQHYSVIPYATRPDGDVPNRLYMPRVEGGVAFTESLALDGGTPRSGFGDIVLDNTDGRLDALFDQDWRDVPVRVLIGDVRWDRADFRLVLAGTCKDIESTRPDQVEIVLEDKLQRLNQPLHDTLIGGTGPNAERLVPVTLGECHNITPLARDTAGENLVFHNATAERLIEARNRGVPVAGSANLPGGRFNLVAQPAGVVTASVQGDRRSGVYRNTVASLIVLLVSAYGVDATQRFVDDDLDLDSLYAFEAAHPQPVGYYAADRVTVLAVCQELAASLGAQVVMSRLGQLRVLQIALPGTGSPTEIRPSNYDLGSLRMVQRVSRVDGVRLGYCRNWSPGSDVTEGLPPAHAALYDQEYMTRYAGAGEPEQINTLLLRGDDAQAEATRRLALWGTQRHVYGVTCGPELLMLELGAPVTLYGDRWGLQAGKTGIVTSLRSDWVRGSVDVEVLI